MDPDVVHDPVFQALLLKFELSGRKLREAVIAMRSFYLTHHKTPQDENSSERWRGALLSESAAQLHQDVEDAAAQLLRYGFEIAPHSNCPLHLEELFKLKLAHRERLEKRMGWGKAEPHPRGIEERVTVDEGPPITLVINPEHWSFTDRGKRSAARRAAREKPAMDPTQPESSESDPSD